VFEEYGLDTVWDVDRYGILLETGGGKERMTRHWNEVGWPPAMAEVSERQAKVLDCHLRKTDIFAEMINAGTIPLRSGVLRLVDEAIADGDIQLAVCSTSNVKAVTNLLYTLMGSHRASKFRIFAGDMVKNKKPAPDVYNMAVSEMNLDKTKCVIIEDSAIGLAAAVAAGISCLVTKSSYTKHEDFSKANKVVEELGDDPISCVTLLSLRQLLPIEAKTQTIFRD
jgi:HAD superfamily hydrolase (TIGR01509 family)